MIDTLTIINALDKAFPQGAAEIRNISGVHLGENMGYINQYIFAVAPKEPGQTSFEHYKASTRKTLEGRAVAIEFRGWLFQDYELAEVEEVLGELARHYGADLDIARIVRDLRGGRPTGEEYYLVVTVNRIPVLLGG